MNDLDDLVMYSMLLLTAGQHKHSWYALLVAAEIHGAMSLMHPFQQKLTLAQLQS